jgi:hypothetical protein
LINSKGWAGIIFASIRTFSKNLQKNSAPNKLFEIFTPKHRSAVQNSHPVFTSPARVLGFQDALACNPCKDGMSQFKIPFVS